MDIRFKDLTNSISSFRTGDVIPVDGPEGTVKMPKDDLLKETAQNTLDSIKSLATTKYKGFMVLDDVDGTGKMDVDTIFNNFAPKFVPSSEPNPTTTVAEQPYMYDGSLYVAKVDGYQGPWDASKFFKISSTFLYAIVNNLIKPLCSFTENRSEWIVVDGKFISYRGIESTNWMFEYFYKPVTAGETYDLTSYCGQDARLWTFLDDDGNVVAVSSDGSDQGEKNEKIIAPYGATKLVVNVLKSQESYLSLKQNIVPVQVKMPVDLENQSVVLFEKGKGLLSSSLLDELGASSRFLNDFENWTVIDGKFISYRGIEESHPDFKYYYKAVEEGQTYAIKSYSYADARLWVMLDENDNVVSLADAYTGENEDVIVIPSGVVKVAVNLYGQHEVSIGLKIVAIPFSHVFGTTDAITKEFGVKDTYIEDLEEWSFKNNYFISYKGTESSNNYFIYFSKSVKSGEVYKISSGSHADARLWVMLDENDSVVSYADAFDGQNEAVVVIPNGVSKLVVNLYKIYDVSIKIKAQSIEVSHVEDSLPSKSNILYGKTLVTCGDSITWGAEIGEEGIVQNPSIAVHLRSGNGFERQIVDVRKTYGFQIAERNNMVFYNDGISGSTIEDIPDKRGFSKENGRYTTLPEHIDYLTIFFGWNDNAYGTLGTIDDNTNQTYFGAFNIVLPYLIDKYPLAKICLIVPYGTTTQMRQAVRDLATKWGVAFFDMYQVGTPLFYMKEDGISVDASIITENRAKYMADAAHPLYAGQRAIAARLEAFLRTL